MIDDLLLYISDVHSPLYIVQVSQAEELTKRLKEVSERLQEAVKGELL